MPKVKKKRRRAKKKSHPGRSPHKPAGTDLHDGPGLVDVAAHARAAAHASAGARRGTRCRLGSCRCPGRKGGQLPLEVRAATGGAADRSGVGAGADDFFEILTTVGAMKFSNRHGNSVKESQRFLTQSYRERRGLGNRVRRDYLPCPRRLAVYPSECERTRTVR